MRLLMLHADRFASHGGAKGRSPFVEPALPPETVVGEARAVRAGQSGPRP